MSQNTILTFPCLGLDISFELCSKSMGFPFLCLVRLVLNPPLVSNPTLLTMFYKIWRYNQVLGFFLQDYCKRCYFRVTKFSRLGAQKHIRGLLNSRWADAHLSFWYCTMLTLFNEWYIYMYVCNWAAQKQSRSHLHQHIYGQYTTPTCPKCAYKILQIFLRVFEFALAEFARNTRKFMYREYFHFYSN